MFDRVPSQFRVLIAFSLLTAPMFSQEGRVIAEQAGNYPREGGRLSVSGNYGDIPLGFEANLGQSDSGVDVVSREPGYSLLLRSGEAELRLIGKVRRTSLEKEREASVSAGEAADARQSDVRLRLVRGRKEARWTGEGKLAGSSSYFIGSDRTKWITDIPNYRRIRYAEVYPGIDLVYYGNHREFEHDFEIAAGADPARIQFSLDGAQSIRLDRATGDLVLTTEAGEMRLLKPVSYQRLKGRRVEIASAYEGNGNGSYRFRLGRYDHAAPLVIDPTLSYSTITDSTSGSIAVGASGTVFTASSQYVSPGHTLVTVTKMNPGGSALVYAATFGGSAGNGGAAVAVDAQENAYITGTTNSTDFPTVSPFQGALGGPNATNGFVTKLNATGDAMLYSSYLGGSGGDSPARIALDHSNNAYIAGTTSSADFPTHLPLQSTLRGASNLFVTSVSADGSSVRYSTYLGGTGADTDAGIGVDSNGEVVVAGTTTSTDFPTAGAIQATFHGVNDGFVAKIVPDGSALAYSTYLGGSDDDRITSVAVDPSGNAYVTGVTFSGDFPVLHALQPTGPQHPYPPGFGFDDMNGFGFVTKINSAGSAFVYSTFLDGVSFPNFDPTLLTGLDFGNIGEGIAADDAGHAFVTGYTFATDFPVTADAFQPQNNGFDPNCSTNAFLTEFAPEGDSLMYSTYFGGASGGDDILGTDYCNGSGGTVAFATALDSLGNVYVGGMAGWPKKGFPFAGGVYEGQTGNGDPFLAKFAYVPVTSTVTTLTSNINPQGVGQPITFTTTVKTPTGGAVTVGSVTLIIDGVPYATGSLAAGGGRTFTVPTLSGEDHPVKAAYSGTIHVNSSSASLIESIKSTPAPTISPGSGTFRVPQNVILKDTSGTAAIYYTTNGMTPNGSSTRYAAPFLVSTPLTVKAVAVDTGKAFSTVTSAVYAFYPRAATPSFSPVGGTYTAAQKVTIIDASPGVSFYYTTNGSTPTVSSTKYVGPIQVNASETFKAIATGANFQTSEVGTAVYAIHNPTATPMFSPAPGHYTVPTKISLSCATPGSNIYMTFDGTTPTYASTRYLGPFTRTTSVTIKAIATSAGRSASPVVTGTYTIP